MPDNFLGPKPVRSVAAFLWMPQFRLSFQHMSHLAPVFVRTLASIFAAAGLIAPNHPALLYGSPEVDGRRASFSALIGDVWFALRTQRSTVSQWGVFLSVAFLLAMTFMACLTTIATVAFGIGGTAQAQLFSHPLPGDSSVDGHVAYPPFDLKVPEIGTPQGDYGIMMLDKVVRAGAFGKGIPIQNALRDLMLTYNSAVLVVASVILFWIIINIVVDTAKTGQVGGGRHNMVWAPIRIVFALALLVPMGSAGFSSGQYMVMKIAEWGSNLGTNAWKDYVEGTLSASNIVADQGSASASELIKNYERIWVCQVSYNAGNQIANSTERMRRQESIGDALDGKSEYNFVDDSNRSCGKLSYEDPNFGMNALRTGLRAAWIGQMDPISVKLDTFKREMRQVYVDALITTFEPAIKKEACRFASTSVHFHHPENLAALQAQPECAGITLNANLTPDTIGYSEFVKINRDFGRQIEAELQTRISTLRNAFQDRSMMEMMTDRGWAGMGAWYHRISQINAVTASLTTPPVTVSANDFGPKLDSNVITNTMEILTSFDNWWVAYPISAGSAAQINPTTGAPAADSVDSSSASDSSGIGAAIKSMVTGGGSVMNSLLGIIINGPSFGAKVMSLMGGGEDVYPLAQLTSIGDKVFGLGVTIQAVLLAIHLAMAVLSTNASVLGIGGGLNLTPLAEAGFFDLIGSLGTVLMISGLMLKVYIPLIPFMRVIFSVLTWVISVFEAVVMVPIAALAHLSTEGDGLAGGAKNVWILWLNILLRPVLTVIGFVGALLVFNAFVSFFNDNFSKSLAAGLPSSANVLDYIISVVASMVIYVFIIYTVANTVFKMLDVIPSAMMRWLGGSPDHSFDNNSDSDALLAASNFMRGQHVKVGRGREKDQSPKPKEKEPEAGASKA